MSFSRTRIATLAWMITLCSSGVAAHAQPETPNPNTTQPAEAELSTTPYLVDKLGLQFYLPLGATATTDPYGSAFVTTIIPMDNPGTITVQSRTSSNETLTAEDVANGVISSMRGFHLLTRNQGLSINGRQADRFYLKAPPSRGADAVMRGVTVFKVTDGHFAIFELITDDSRFASARPVYEAMVGSAKFTDSADQAQQQATALEASSQLLRSLTEEDYKQALKLTHNRWERLYTPAISGDDFEATEHGYRRIKAWYGQRGELTPSKSKNIWSAMEKQRGSIVQIDAKLIDNNYQVHTEAIYFLSQSRREEAWTVRMALKQGAETTVWTETGARSGSSLTISVSDSQGTPTTVEPTIEGLGYLSVLETHLLGPLLISTGETGEYSFYSYQSSTGTVRLRTDSLKIDEQTGGYTLLSRYEEGAQPQTSVFTKDGTLIRVSQPDGKIWEPIEQNRLVRLWEAKGLLED